MYLLETSMGGRAALSTRGAMLIVIPMLARNQACNVGRAAAPLVDGRLHRGKGVNAELLFKSYTFHVPLHRLLFSAENFMQMERRSSCAPDTALDGPKGAPRPVSGGGGRVRYLRQ